jgi:tetratricopeptide (TPR) repeat protein
MMQPTDIRPQSSLRTSFFRVIRYPRTVAFLIAVLVVAAISFAYERYEVSRLAGSVRGLFAARRYDEARSLVQRWIRQRPRSGEAQYYRAWLALVDQQPEETLAGIQQALQLGVDPALLRPINGICQARAGQINKAEPLLREAFDQEQEPRAEVARELARIYLATYRMTQAAEPIERWRTLDPKDPEPYLASNEIASRAAEEPAIQIRNYQAALERNPDLDKARLGLAEQLTKAQRFDEAEQEFLTYLKRKPGDASALVGQGRNALQSGDRDRATKCFEAALQIDPRQPDALKELAQMDLQVGRFGPACRRLELLTQIDPYDPEIRYSYAQSLMLSGEQVRGRSEHAIATRLRAENDDLVKLRTRILGNPNDQESRFKVTKWMFDHGHPGEGLKWAREVLRAAPNHGPTHRLLAEYYQKQGDVGLANYHRLQASSSSP